MWLDCPDFYLGTPHRVSYHRCAGCGLVQQYPLLAAADLQLAYDAYPIHQAKSSWHGRARRWIMRGVYYQHRGPTDRLTLLDYGCGDGGFLTDQAGRYAERLGFEVNPAHAGRLSQHLAIPIYCDMERLRAERRGCIDVLTMHFVLEHVQDLNGVFQTVRDLLRPGGSFYFVVPHVDSLEADLFGPRWHGLDPPRHISFPGPAVVEKLGQLCGLRLRRQRAVAFPNGVAGSLPVVLSGRFRFDLFMLALPLGLICAWICPSGSRAYWLTKV
jgi:SAM-dependent methyltransferase